MIVYEIKELGETTHIAFDGDAGEALMWYIDETMCDETEIDSIQEVPQEKWNKIKVKFEEYGIKPFTMTIEELMDGQISNEILCSTAYL